MKYPLDDGGVGTIKGDQKVARECYLASLKPRRKEASRKEGRGDSVNMMDLIPREEYQQERLEPTKTLKEVAIGLTFISPQRLELYWRPPKKKV